MRTSKSILAGVAAGALGAALVPFVGVGAANAAVTSLTASTAVAAATANQTPSPGGTLANKMDLIYIQGDDTFATATSQYVVSIRLDSAPTGGDGVTPAAIQLSDDTANPTVGSGYALTTAGASTTAPTVTAPGNYLWTTGSVVQLQNNSATTRTLALQGTAPTAGSYGFTAWVNNGTSNFNSLEPGEPFTTGTLTVGGTVASFTMTPAAQSVGANQVATYLVTAKDSSGRATFPTGNAGTSTGSWANVATTPAGLTVGADSSAATVGTLSAAKFITSPVEQGTAALTLQSATAGTYGINVGPGGTLPGTVTAATGTITVNAVTTLKSAISNGPSANSSNPTTYTPQASITASGSATGNVFVPTTQPKVTFLMTADDTATAGQLLAYSVTDSSGATKAGVTTGSFTTAIDANRQAKVEVTATTITSGTTYTVVLGQGSRLVTYTVTYGVPALSITNLSTVPPLGSTSFAQTNTAVPVAAEVTDQYGQKLSNITVISVPSVSAASTGVTDASGAALVTIPAAGSSVSQTVDFKVQAPLGSPSLVTGTPITVIYNASGAPSSLTATTAAGSVTATAAATQNVDVVGTGGTTWATNGNTGWMAVTATVGGGVTGVPVTFSAPDAYFAPASANALNSATTKSGAITAATGGGGTATVYVKPTKTGTVTVTLRAGSLSAPITWKVANTADNARVIKVTPEKQDAAGIAQVTATVTDVFGNPVPAAVARATAAGDVLLAGLGQVGNVTMGDAGSASVTAVALRNLGTGSITLAGTSANWNAAAPGYVPPPGAPAPKLTAKVDVTIEPTVDATISIIGERDGRMVMVDGETTGLNAGATVTPFFRFPGQTSYTAGSGVRTIDADGNFQWQRKTGKKIYVYFESGTVKSNRVIIDAR